MLTFHYIQSFDEQLPSKQKVNKDMMTTMFGLEGRTYRDISRIGRGVVN